VSWNPTFFDQSPLYWPSAAMARRFAEAPQFPAIEDWNSHLSEELPVRFQLAPPAGRRRRAPLDARTLYDGRIALERVVPSRRENWHDFLNALVWSAFPRSKMALHCRQHREIAARIGAGDSRLPGARTRSQDVLALVDEGGAVVLSGQPLSNSVQVQEAVDSGRACAMVFGHGIYEDLVRTGGSLQCTATAVVVSVETIPVTVPERLAAADHGLARRLADDADFQQPVLFPRLGLLS
jgi:hypothetical protein